MGGLSFISSNGSEMVRNLVHPVGVFVDVWHCVIVWPTFCPPAVPIHRDCVGVSAFGPLRGSGSSPCRVPRRRGVASTPRILHSFARLPCSIEREAVGCIHTWESLIHVNPVWPYHLGPLLLRGEVWHAIFGVPFVHLVASSAKLGTISVPTGMVSALARYAP